MSRAYSNSYQAATGAVDDLHAATAEDEYDHNYVFEVKRLRSDRVELRPFTPSLHSRLLLQGHIDVPELSHWLPMKFETVEDVHRFVETSFRRNPASCFYAIFTGPLGADPAPTDPKDYEFAGAIGMINSSRDDMVSELGFIQILKPFQRTHVLSHAAGCVIHRILDSEAEGGLGLRRCQWFANSLNEPSKAAGKRLGFKEDGQLRNHRVLGEGKAGANEGRKGDYREKCMSRDTWVGSITWQDWENGGAREHVDKLMARRQ